MVHVLSVDQVDAASFWEREHKEREVCGGKKGNCCVSVSHRNDEKKMNLMQRKMFTDRVAFVIIFDRSSFFPSSVTAGFCGQNGIDIRNSISAFNIFKILEILSR